MASSNGEKLDCYSLRGARDTTIPASSRSAARGESVKKVLEYTQSFVTIALILAGIGGVAYHMFKENGWLSTVLGKIWDIQMENPVVAIPVTLAALFIGKMWYDHNRLKGYTSKLPDILIYVIMAAGVYFIWQFFTQGLVL
jgi:hypothetical protein